MTNRKQLFKTLKYLPLVVTTVSTPWLAGNAMGAPDKQSWYVRPHVAYSQLSDISGDSLVEGAAAGADIALSGGFAAGLGLGYFYRPNFAVELSWEYRSNDSEVALDDGRRFSDGNYASNSFYLNAIHHFARQDAWQPYVGGGLVWIQEVDIDLEDSGQEISFEADGDMGWQAFAGMNYWLNERWAIHGEMRYGSVTGIDLGSESGNGRINDLEYQPLSLQTGVLFYF